MTPIPLPPGLEIPEGEPVEVSATVQMMDGELILLALDGVPLEGEMEAEGEEEMGDEDFMAAVERGLQG
jgi:hypothetical protein